MGIPLGVVLQLISMYLLPQHPVISTVVSGIVLFAGCYAFELFSLITGKGHYELMDVWAGLLGGVIGIAVVLLLTHY